jgi:hypothetical protein
VQADRPFSEPDCLRAHVRIRGDPALLCIGAELEICSEHAADCFGKVVACSLSRAASVYTLDVEVFRHVVYLPCSRQLLHANLTEVFHIFIEKDDATKSPQLLAAITRRTTAAAANHDAAQRAVAAISATKERAKELASKPIRITVDQLGMVRLRQSFLVVQPLISEILMRLMQEWQPDAAARAVEYKKAFHSSDGPWDVFSVFFPVTNTSIKCSSCVSKVRFSVSSSWSFNVMDVSTLLKLLISQTKVYVPGQIFSNLKFPFSSVCAFIFWPFK